MLTFNLLSYCAKETDLQCPITQLNSLQPCQGPPAPASKLPSSPPCQDLPLFGPAYLALALLASPSSGQPAVESNFSCCACFCFLYFLSSILPHLGRLRASPPQCRSPRAPVAVTRPSLSLLRLPRPPPPPSRRSRSVVCEPPRYVLASLNWSSRYLPRDLLRAPVSRCLYRLRMLTSRPRPPVPLHQKCSPASRCRRQ